MRSERLAFPGHRGDRLAAQLDRPDEGEPVGYALFAHCFTCSKNLKAMQRIDRALTDQGFGVLRFDFTGLGESEGDFAETNFSSNVDDLVAATRYLEAEHEAPRILVGHSFGGAAVLQAAHRVPSCRAVATIAAPCKPAHIKHLLAGREAEIAERGETEVTLAGRAFRIQRHFLDDLDEQRMDAFIANLRRALLVLHGPFDDTVGIENAAHIFEAAKHPKSFISLDRADHLLSDDRDARYVGTMVASWAQRYL
ncbi:MAG: alpha/beta hydrolase family protein [Candidatus Bipolaricaulia bacterium]